MASRGAADLMIGIYWNTRTKRWDIAGYGTRTGAPVRDSADSQIALGRVELQLLVEKVRLEIESFLG